MAWYICFHLYVSDVDLAIESTDSVELDLSVLELVTESSQPQSDFINQLVTINFTEIKPSYFGLNIFLEFTCFYQMYMEE